MDRLQTMIADALMELHEVLRDVKTEDDLYEVVHKYDLDFYDDGCSIMHSDTLLDVLNGYFEFGYMIPEQFDLLLPWVCDKIGLVCEECPPSEDGSSVGYKVYFT